MDTDNRYGTLAMQKRLLTLLKAFHQLCVAKNIKYSLDWGSLLGAVRHKGFIPWDDDLDVMLDRQNYERLRSLKISNELVYEHGTPKALWIDRIRLKDKGTDGHKPTMDVFVVDNAPDGRLARKIRVLEIRFAQGMMKTKPRFKKGNLLYRTATFISYVTGTLMTRKQKVCLYNWLMQRSNGKDTEKKASYNTDFGDVPKLYDKDVLKEVMEVSFEDTKAYITKAYHQCLIDKFGPDYMTPPSEKDRRPKHL